MTEYRPCVFLSSINMRYILRCVVLAPFPVPLSLSFSPSFIQFITIFTLSNPITFLSSFCRYFPLPIFYSFFFFLFYHLSIIFLSIFFTNITKYFLLYFSSSSFTAYFIYSFVFFFPLHLILLIRLLIIIIILFFILFLHIFFACVQNGV